MPKKFFLVISLILLTFGCAKRGFITGGEQDLSPPKVVKTIPENFSTHFNSKKITIQFDEYVRLKEINKQLIVSPSLKHRPEITPMSVSREITIRLKDTLQPNTTYSFNFGRSIEDNNEGNPLRGYKYVFSTGNYIDSLSIDGTISDALNREPEKFVSVLLYEIGESFNDSIIYKENPRYITNTLDTISFRLENIAQGNYFLIALKDQNNNNRFDPKQDKIAFYSQPVSVPTQENFKLELFKEIPDFKPIRAFQTAKNKIVLTYEGNAEQTQIELRNQSDLLNTIVSKFPEKDSLNVWFDPIEADSLELNIRHNNTEKIFSVKLKDQKSDTLSLAMKSSKKLEFSKNVIFASTTPLVSFDLSKFELLTRDSLAIELEIKYEKWHQQLELIFEKEEEQKYALTIFPGAITDFFGQTNDTIKADFSTSKYSDYGNLRVVLQGVKEFPVIVQLTDDKGKILAENYLEQENSVDFFYLKPMLYNLRIVYDFNQNKIWDTGNYLKKIQPEKVIYYPEKIDVRANWDIEQNFILKE